MRCDTCKFYGRSVEDYSTDYGWSPISTLILKPCTKIKMPYDVSEWHENEDGRFLKPGHENDKAFVQDGSDYMATLWVLPDFGCVMWEKA